MEKIKSENNLIKNHIPRLNVVCDNLKSEEKEIDRALFNIILSHPELIEENSLSDRLKLFDRYVGKGGHMKFIKDQIRGMVNMKCSEQKILEFIDRQTNEHRSDLIQDDLRHLKELNNYRWNLFELEYDENRPGNLGASFSLIFSGVYAVYEDIKIIYIGTAINLRQRFIQHVFPSVKPLLETPLYKYLNGDFRSIKIKTKKIDKKFKRLTLEGQLIHKIKPVVNCHYKIRES